MILLMVMMKTSQQKAGTYRNEVSLCLERDLSIIMKLHSTFFEIMNVTIETVDKTIVDTQTIWFNCDAMLGCCI